MKEVNSYEQAVYQVRRLLQDRIVAYHPTLSKALHCGAATTVFLSQLMYWTGKEWDDEGWIWKTQKELYEETGLTRSEQETARKHLIAAGILDEKRAEIPAKLWYRINWKNLYDLLSIEAQSTMRESSIQKSGNPAFSDAEM